MNDLEHLFRLGSLIIVGRAMPGLIVEVIRRGGNLASRARRALARPSQPQVLQSTSDFPLEQTP